MKSLLETPLDLCLSYLSLPPNHAPFLKLPHWKRTCRSHWACFSEHGIPQRRSTRGGEHRKRRESGRKEKEEQEIRRKGKEREKLKYKTKQAVKRKWKILPQLSTVKQNFSSDSPGFFNARSTELRCKTKHRRRSAQSACRHERALNSGANSASLYHFFDAMPTYSFLPSWNEREVWLFHCATT